MELLIAFFAVLAGGALLVDQLSPVTWESVLVWCSLGSACLLPLYGFIGTIWLLLLSKERVLGFWRAAAHWGGSMLLSFLLTTGGFFAASNLDGDLKLFVYFVVMTLPLIVMSAWYIRLAYKLPLLVRVVEHDESSTTV